MTERRMSVDEHIAIKLVHPQEERQPNPPARRYDHKTGLYQDGVAGGTEQSDKRVTPAPQTEAEPPVTLETGARRDFAVAWDKFDANSNPGVFSRADRSLAETFYLKGVHDTLRAQLEQLQKSIDNL